MSDKIEHMSYHMIRASEVGEYLYCRRAWWLRRVAGYRPVNFRELSAGTNYHRSHGDQLRRSNWGQRIALVLIFVSVSLLAYLLVQLL